MIFLAGLIIGLVIGFGVTMVIIRIKYPKAGTVLIDMRRDAVDTIEIQGTRNLSQWQYKKGLHFNVEVKG